MKIGIVACNALKDEIEKITAGDESVVHREYLDFGLHTTPDDMREKIIESVNALEGRVDVVFLGYATCQSLSGVPSFVRVPTVMLETDDCIAALLTPDKYSKEKRGGGMITWFYPAGWAREGPDGMTKLFHLDCMQGEGYQPEYFLKIMFDGFGRCIYISTGMKDSLECEKISRDFAASLDLRHESMEGTLEMLEEAYQKTKSLGEELQRTKAL